MNEEFRNRERESLADKINKVRNFVMGLLFIAMGLMMCLAEKYSIYQLLDFPPILRYFFGGICFLYGGFRLWRAFKNKY